MIYPTFLFAICDYFTQLFISTSLSQWRIDRYLFYDLAYRLMPGYMFGFDFGQFAHFQMALYSPST